MSLCLAASTAFAQQGDSKAPATTPATPKAGDAIVIKLDREQVESVAKVKDKAGEILLKPQQLSVVRAKWPTSKVTSIKALASHVATDGSLAVELENNALVSRAPNAGDPIVIKLEKDQVESVAKVKDKPVEVKLNAQQLGLIRGRWAGATAVIKVLASHMSADGTVAVIFENSAVVSSGASTVAAEKRGSSADSLKSSAGGVGAEKKNTAADSLKSGAAALGADKKNVAAGEKKNTSSAAQQR
jgi:hypothetical protein